jgi:hypothetical protein
MDIPVWLRRKTGSDTLSVFVGPEIVFYDITDKIA